MLPGPIRLRKHNVSIFQRTIEHILQYKQMRVIKGLRANVRLQKEFRYNQRQRRLQSLFEAILNESEESKVLRDAKKHSDKRKVSKIFYTLKHIAQRKRSLAAKMELIRVK